MARWPQLRPDVAFDLCLDHGRCVGIRLPTDEAILDESLPAEERAFASTLTAVRRRTWLGGRAALREALLRAGIDAPAVLADDRGAPRLPSGICGSISHKETLAVALVTVAASSPSARIGIDVELNARPGPDIASRVLTDEERMEVDALDSALRDGEVLLRFSAKEALYKALDPFVRRYVAFKEVSVRPKVGGSCEVRLHLAAAEGRFYAEVRWMRWEDFFLTTAMVSR